MVNGQWWGLRLGCCSLTLRINRSPLTINHLSPLYAFVAECTKIVQYMYPNCILILGFELVIIKGLFLTAPLVAAFTEKSIEQMG
jgi:hypothetical protein